MGTICDLTKVYPMSNESSTPVLPVFSEFYPLNNKWWNEVEKITPLDAVLASMGIDPETFSESLDLERSSTEGITPDDAPVRCRPSLGAEQDKFEQRYNELLAAINACEIACEDQNNLFGNFTYTIAKIRKDDFVAWVIDPLIAWDLPTFIKQNPSGPLDSSIVTLESMPIKARREAVAKCALKELVTEGIFKEFGNILKTTNEIHKKMRSRSDFQSFACSNSTLRNFLFLKPDSIWNDKIIYKKEIERLKAIKKNRRPIRN